MTTMRRIWLVSFLCATACHSPTDNDDSGAVAGTYVTVRANGHTLPVELFASDTLRIELRSASLLLFEDRTYALESLRYEFYPSGVTKGIPVVGRGVYELRGGAIEFTAISGISPSAATIQPDGGLRVVQRVRPGAADTLLYEHRPTPPAATH